MWGSKKRVKEAWPNSGWFHAQFLDSKSSIFEIPKEVSFVSKSIWDGSHNDWNIFKTCYNIPIAYNELKLLKIMEELFDDDDD